MPASLETLKILLEELAEWNETSKKRYSPQELPYIQTKAQIAIALALGVIAEQSTPVQLGVVTDEQVPIG